MLDWDACDKKKHVLCVQNYKFDLFCCMPPTIVLSISLGKFCVKRFNVTFFKVFIFLYISMALKKDSDKWNNFAAFEIFTILKNIFKYYFKDIRNRFLFPQCRNHKVWHNSIFCDLTRILRVFLLSLFFSLLHFLKENFFYNIFKSFRAYLKTWIKSFKHFCLIQSSQPQEWCTISSSEQHRFHYRDLLASSHTYVTWLFFTAHLFYMHPYLSHFWFFFFSYFFSHKSSICAN